MSEGTTLASRLTRDNKVGIYNIYTEHLQYLVYLQYLRPGGDGGVARCRGQDRGLAACPPALLHLHTQLR